MPDATASVPPPSLFPFINFLPASKAHLSLTTKSKNLQPLFSGFQRDLSDEKKKAKRNSKLLPREDRNEFFNSGFYSPSRKRHVKGVREARTTTRELVYSSSGLNLGFSISIIIMGRLAHICTLS